MCTRIFPVYVKHLLTAILPILLLTCCTGQHIRHELYRIDTLNQKDIPLDTISTIVDVVDYLDIWGDANEQMTAHYLLGCYFHSQGNAPKALHCYRDAINYADTTSANCDFRRLSRIYGQMANLFNLQRAPQLEIEAEQKAVAYAWKAKDTLAALTFYEYLCAPYHQLNKLDSCLFFIEDAARLFKKHGYPNLAIGMAPYEIDILLKRKDYEVARQKMDEFEQSEPIIQENGEVAKGQELYYYYKGYYYAGIGKSDSAEYFYRKLLQSGIDHDKLCAAYQGLLNLYHQVGNSDSIAKYALLYYEANDSSSILHSSDEIVRMQSIYNYDESEQRAFHKTEEARRYKQTLVTIVISCLLCIYAVFLFIKKQKQKGQKAIALANAEYSRLLQQHQHLQDEIASAHHGWDNYRKKKETEILQLQIQIASIGKLDEWNMEQAMLHYPIVMQLHELASHAQVPSKHQWREFRELMAQVLSNFLETLKQRCDFLTDQEEITALLIRLEFTQGEQATLLGVSKQRINNLKSSINSKVFNEKGASSLNKNLANI